MTLPNQDPITELLGPEVAERARRYREELKVQKMGANDAQPRLDRNLLRDTHAGLEEVRAMLMAGETLEASKAVADIQGRILERYKKWQIQEEAPQ